MNQEKEHGMCIVVMCGLPGVGKSTLCHLLQQNLGRCHGDKLSSDPRQNDDVKCHQNSESESTNKLDKHPSFESKDSPLYASEVCVKDIQGQKKDGHVYRSSNVVESKGTGFVLIPVCYDDLMSEEEERVLIQASLDSEKQDTSEWKTYRDKILLCVDFLIQLKSGNSSNESLKKDMLDKALWDRLGIHGNLNSIEEDNKDIVIVIDDNMYYRSMRYKYYQLARKHQIGFCEVYIECEKSIAIQRNQQRSRRRTPENIIISMATKIEKPDPVTFPWEKYCLNINGTQLINSIPDIIHLIQAAIDNPVQPITEEDTEAKELSRQICSTNQIHQADQIMRKLISQEMAKTRDKNLTKSELQFKAKQLCSKRTGILDNLRSGEILLASETLEDKEPSENSTFHSFICDLFISASKENNE